MSHVKIKTRNKGVRPKLVVSAFGTCAAAWHGMASLRTNVRVVRRYLEGMYDVTRFPSVICDMDTNRRRATFRAEGAQRGGVAELIGRSFKCHWFFRFFPKTLNYSNWQSSRWVATPRPTSAKPRHFVAASKPTRKLATPSLKIRGGFDKFFLQMGYFLPFWPPFVRCHINTI